MVVGQIEHGGSNQLSNNKENAKCNIVIDRRQLQDNICGFCQTKFNYSTYFEGIYYVYDQDLLKL